MVMTIMADIAKGKMHSTLHVAIRLHLLVNQKAMMLTPLYIHCTQIVTIEMADIASKQIHFESGIIMKFGATAPVLEQRSRNSGIMTCILLP